MSSIPQGFKLPVIKGKTFDSGSITLDTVRYENCIFRNCEVVYHGNPAETSSCYFENVEWRFEGAAAMTVVVMRGLGWKVEPPK